jgi:hypothetical protein
MTGKGLVEFAIALPPQNQRAGVLAQAAGIRAHEQLDVLDLPRATLSAQLADRVAGILPPDHVRLRQLPTIDIHWQFSAHGNTPTLQPTTGLADRTKAIIL